LVSGYARARTQVAHWAPDGNAAPLALVVNRAGPAAAAMVVDVAVLVGVSLPTVAVGVGLAAVVVCEGPAVLSVSGVARLNPASAVVVARRSMITTVAAAIATSDPTTAAGQPHRFHDAMAGTIAQFRYRHCFP